MQTQFLELLAPARDAGIGIEAIRHGADAVYIGGPAFGARAGAGNSLADIARLVTYAHRFHAKILVAFNTILDDAELETARQLAWQLHELGVDALIVQDMGLLAVDLPPIQLHASTQCDIRTPEKARFLQDVGFSQIVLARELTLEEIRQVRQATDPARCTLEFFIHGALCVAFSGQCYISHAHSGRSANRGECSQACRLPYTLEDTRGRIVAYDQHLLSVKDNDQSANLHALIEAGIHSFKIEGRYKDMAYVKNAVAHYRQLLDAFMSATSGYRAASSGHVQHLFTPQPEKTFNRGTTDYFVQGRKPDIGAFETPKFSGEPIGAVTRIGADWFEIDGDIELSNGDGLSYQPASNKGANKRVGMRINIARGQRLWPNEMPDDLKPGLTLYRNRDQAFERALEKDSAERRIGLEMWLTASDDASTPTLTHTLSLSLTDADGVNVTLSQPASCAAARDREQAVATLKTHLGKLGSTDFVATRIDIDSPCFVPASQINALRRDAISALVAAREAARPRLQRAAAVEPPVAYPERALTYLGNVFNAQARAFYKKHGVELIAEAYEANRTPGEVSLMITKHCLRYSFNLCPKEAKDWQIKGIKAEPMTLINGSERLTLQFDCKACEMHVIGRAKKPARVISLKVQET
ncbi:MAG: U32 family peptidase [Sterolibacterium sp.]|jgi:putative protease|nr:U32 family peptidase [Sterolibacterium sp.]